MTRHLGPLMVLALAAACSRDKPADSAYESSTIATTEANDADLVPASSDSAREPAPRTTSDPERAGDVPVTSAAAPDTIPPAEARDPAPATADRKSDTAPPRADNTKVNKRDADTDALTPIDQGESASDLKITQQIRKAIVGDGSLSFTAKNVKIITNNGKVTLRGPVNSAAERATIEAAARKVAGAGKVDSQLEIVQ
jgi:hyperosmotically inducible protein